MKKLKQLGFLCVAFLCVGKMNAQKIESALAKYKEHAPQEKLYVQFDNSAYLTGQTIWYKAYFMNGFQPSQLSKNFYIDWYDENGKILNTSVTPIVSSASSGHFEVPETYVGSTIHAVAYTKWMQNFDSTYYFEKPLRVVTKKGSTSFIKSDYKKTIVTFLPESGNIIANKLNVIAFKSLNNLGLPENVNGIIRNNRGDSVTSFKTQHDGMGKLQFVPMADQSYYAVWKDRVGIENKTLLPKIATSGVNLTIEPGRSNRLFRVQRTKDVPSSLQQLTLVGQMNGDILFMAKLDLSDKESITSMLPLNKMLSGILQLTVFDANEKPVCERLVFVKNEDYKLLTSITADTISTIKRSKNVFEIALEDTTYTNLSLAVTDANISEQTDNNIVSQLLLKGELGGSIYKPAYYFSNNADSVNNHLDLVMLTNGWRRYDWSGILDNSYLNTNLIKDSIYQTLKGNIINYANRKSKKAESINLIFVAKDSSNSMIILPILEDGSFETKNAMLYDTTKVFYKINGSTFINNENVIIQNNLFTSSPKNDFQFQNEFIDTLGLFKLQGILKEQARLDSMNKYNTLKEVTVVSKQKARIKELDRKYTFGLFSGEAAAAFDMSTLENASHTIDIFDFLDGKVPGLQFTSNVGGTVARVAEFRRGYASFYLNGNLINESEVANINMSTVAYIKVFNPPAISGHHGSGGAIAIYTKKGDDVQSGNKNVIPKGLDYKLNRGYTGYKEFYNPNYAEKTDDNLKDVRTTLYWNPWISLDKNSKKVKIIFFNNDITNSFRIVLEGMDSKGKLVSIHQNLK